MQALEIIFVLDSRDIVSRGTDITAMPLFKVVLKENVRYGQWDLADSSKSIIQGSLGEIIVSTTQIPPSRNRYP